MDNESKYWDEVTGKPLDAGGVKKARSEEMGHVHNVKEYTKVRIKMCWDRTGKGPIKVRWLDINKGDEVSREYRSRLVGQEFKRDKREDIFAATPPLEAKKALISMAVTEGVGFKTGKHKSGMCIDFIDVSRAFFHADALRTVYIQLPEGDAEQGMCGLLGKSLYGTNDAAQNWAASYVGFMEDTGFVTGISSPCCFYQMARNIRCAVHGNDFAVLCERGDLEWFREQIKGKYPVKFRGGWDQGMGTTRVSAYSTES